MLRTKLSVATALALCAGLLAGCGKVNNVADPTRSNNPGSTGEQAKVATAMASQPQLVDDEISESSDQTALGGSAQGALAAINPITFWRHIDRVERSFEFVFSDTDSSGRPRHAIVTVDKRLLGTFNILAGVPADSVLPNVVVKPLDDRWIRRILLVRVPDRDDTSSTDHDRERWRIAGTSAVKVTSKDAATKIVSLRIQAGALDAMITTPLEIFRLASVLKFDAGTQVTLTATTLRNDDVVVFRHRDHRFLFHNNGDDTYTGVWTVGAADGVRHFDVNALAHGTLFDDQAAYDSQQWILPYVVLPTQLADVVE